ncbi:carbohydrate sulfotransferase 3-like [Mytilus trossulus]|uniref:carbohydrate sulfotransferase 3-like n=1 Tax=Mytilus trossulus TaxID=6551 RepID=UPI003003ED48
MDVFKICTCTNRRKLVFTLMFASALIYTMQNQGYNIFSRNTMENLQTSTNVENTVLNMSIHSYTDTYTNQNTKRISAQGPRDILLFGYQRGETTFVGHILGCRKDTFYFYEPFWSISKQKYFTKSQKCDTHKDVCRNYDNNTLNISRLVSSLYACDSDTIGKLVSSVQSEHSCTRNREKFKSKDVQKLHNICKQAKYRVTKMLRISAEFIENLLQINPKLQIVYLYRDPRAIISSRLKSKARPIKDLVTAVCNKMDIDSSTVIQIANKYPQNVILVSAESIAKDPVNISRKLFEFLDLKFTKSDENQINSLSNWNSKRKKMREGNFNPYKNNGYASSMKWRTVLSRDIKAIADSLCQSVYQRLGYLNMTSAEYFRNINETNIFLPKKIKEFSLH